jgi:hypothetical protein
VLVGVGERVDGIHGTACLGFQPVDGFFGCVVVGEETLLRVGLLRGAAG